MALQIFRCLYHGEKNGKLDESFGQHLEYIAAADGQVATLSAVLTSAGKNVPAGDTLHLDSVSNHGVGSVLS